MDAARWVTVGRLVGLHGVRGGLKLRSFTEPAEHIFAYAPWRVVLAERRLDLSQAPRRTPGRALLAQLPGIEDREAAAGWIGAEIRVPRAALPELPQGQWYWADLEGLEVINLERVALGRVSHVLATGANDVLVVRDGARERLLPFVPGQWVREVDLAGGRIVVDWDPGF